MTDAQVAELTRIWNGTEPTPEAYAKAAIAYLCPPPKYKVVRGEVRVGSKVLGYVDKYDPTKEKRVGTTYRAVKQGGVTSTQRYATQAEAAEWVVAP